MPRCSAYIAGSPFVIIELFSISPELYGFLFAAHVIALMIGSAANSRLVTRVGVDRMLLLGAVGLAFGGVLVFFAGALTAPLAALIGSVVVMMLFVTMIGADATAGALSEFPNMAGTASAFPWHAAVRHGRRCWGVGRIFSRWHGDATRHRHDVKWPSSPRRKNVAVAWVGGQNRLRATSPPQSQAPPVHPLHEALREFGRAPFRVCRRE